MTYRVTLSPSARRALSRDLPESVAVACMNFIDFVIAENPYRVGKQLGEPFYPFYSARRGEYRIIYEIRREEVVVHIVAIKHRRDAYRT